MRNEMDEDHLSLHDSSSSSSSPSIHTDSPLYYHMDKMMPECLLNSLRSSLIPGWGLRPPLMGTIPGLNGMINPLMAMTGVSQPIHATTKDEDMKEEKKEMDKNDSEEVIEEDEGSDDDSDHESDKTDHATSSRTPSTLSSPITSSFPLSPTSLLSNGRRHSTGQSSSKTFLSSTKKRVTCDICGKSYCDKGALKIHTSAVHLKEMQMCTVPGCMKEFTSRRSRNRHSKNKNMKLHTSDPSKLAALTAIQEQARLFTTTTVPTMNSSPSAPLSQNRKRKAGEGALDLSIHSEDPYKPNTILPPIIPNHSVQFMLLQQLMHNQLVAQHNAAVAAVVAVSSPSIPSTVTHSESSSC